MAIECDPEAKKITMRRVPEDNHCGRIAKTGPLKCRKGFTARARLKTPRRGKSTWYNETVYLIDAKVPVGECEDKINSVYNKEDPDTWAYGVYPGGSNGVIKYNLKTTSNESTEPLPQSEPVIIKYDKESGRCGLPLPTSTSTRPTYQKRLTSASQLTSIAEALRSSSSSSP